MPTLGASDAAAVVEATTYINRLLQLDEVWTQAALEGPPFPAGSSPDEKTGELANLVEVLTDQLHALDSHRAHLSALVERHAVEAEDVFGELLWSDLLNRETREDLRWWVKGRSLREIWSGAEADISEAAARAEAEQLHDQLARIGRGYTISGDLSKSFRCGSANGLLVGGILVVPGGVGVGAGVAAAGAAGLAVGAGIATGGIGLLIAGTALWWARKIRC